jgi:PknH-like extracellular domain
VRWLHEKLMARVAALMAIVTLAAGCSVAVGGVARPVSNVAARSVGGRTIKRVLLGKSALSRIVRQPLTIDPRYPPIFGGPRALAGDKSPWPDDCIGVAVMLDHSVYQDSNVEDVALATWRPTADSAAVTGVKEGIISLVTAADAQGLFVKFSRQWQRCEGKAVPLSGGAFRLRAKVDNVQIATSVLAATISIELDSPNPLLQVAVPAGRAIGVRDNCLVEVEVDFGNGSNPSTPQPGDISTSALDIAQVMRDKVSALS